MATPGRMIRRALRGAGALVVVLSLSGSLGGCAYYNTFYHAKKYYGDAEGAARTEARAGANLSAQSGTRGSRSAGLYNSCIEKCDKMIANYPGSKWQDDAHLLRAKAYYGRRDYLAARQGFSRFPQRFPDSNLVPDSWFWLGRTEFALENYETAAETWTTLLASYPDFDERDEVEYLLADAEWNERDLESAEAAFLAFLADDPGGDREWDARLRLGRVLLERGQYEEAESYFNQVAGRSPHAEQRQEAILHLGDCFERQGRLDEAYGLYVGLARDLDPNVFGGRMSGAERQQLEADLQAAAEAAYQDSIAARQFLADNGDSLGVRGATPASTNPNDPNLFATNDPNNPNNTTGNPSPDPRNPNLPNNEDELPQGVTVPSPTELANQVDPNAARAQAQAQQEQQRKRVRDINNEAERELAKVMLREGTVLAKMERPWDAIEAYEQVVAEYPRTPFAAEAQYQIGYTCEIYLEDFPEAQAAYEKVSTQGRSAFTDAAQRKARNLKDTMARLQATAQDTSGSANKAAVEARFMKAELYLFQQDKPERALEEYRGIENDFAGSDYAGKAALAQAWVQFYAMADTARGRAQYADVMRQYANTEYGRRARRLLRGPAREPEEADYYGPTLAMLRDPENLALFAARDSVEFAEQALAAAQREAQGLPADPAGANTAGANGTGDAAGVAAAGALAGQSSAEAQSMAARQAELLERRRRDAAEGGQPGEASLPPPQGAAAPVAQNTLPADAAGHGVVQNPATVSATGAAATGAAVTAGAAMAGDGDPAPVAAVPAVRPLPTGRSGKTLDPHEVPADGYTPVMKGATPVAGVPETVARPESPRNTRTTQPPKKDPPAVKPAKDAEAPKKDAEAPKKNETPKKDAKATKDPDAKPGAD